MVYPEDMADILRTTEGGDVLALVLQLAIEKTVQLMATRGNKAAIEILGEKATLQ